MLSVVSESRLSEIAAAGHDPFASAVPFPHVVVDNLLDEGYLVSVAGEFPAIGSPTWRRHVKTTSQEKYTNADVDTMGEYTRALIADLQSDEFCEFLSTLTGISGLRSDPTLEGGGMHQIGPGGFLKIHADFRRHPTMPLERRLNLLCYLNEGWDPTWGGAIELWDREMTRCVVEVLPRLGTTVVFETSAESYHGHPDPLRCPPDVARKSIALYYYTPIESGVGGDLDPTTHYRARPGEAVAARAEGIPASSERSGSSAVRGLVSRITRRRH
ncbi:MAG: 2OG-Fe(II) oxygenase [Actinomycetota bacterium]